MTKKNALTIAMTALNFINTTEAEEARATIESMIEQLSKTRTTTEEQKAAASEKRKAATAAARAELVAQVAPVITKVLSDTPLTAKEIYAACASKLPADFTAAKVQNVLLREMHDSVVITETKGKANTYHLA